MTEIEALVQALIMIRQIGRGDVSETSRAWAYEQVGFLSDHINTLKKKDPIHKDETIGWFPNGHREIVLTPVQELDVLHNIFTRWSTVGMAKNIRLTCWEKCGILFRGPLMRTRLRMTRSDNGKGETRGNLKMKNSLASPPSNSTRLFCGSLNYSSEVRNADKG